MVNQVLLVGRIANNIETLQFDSGNILSKFTIALNTKVKGEQITDYIDIEIWNNQYIGKYGAKGNIVIVNGQLKTKTYQRKDGTNAKSVFINAYYVSVVNDTKEEETSTEHAKNDLKNDFSNNEYEEEDYNEEDEFDFDDDIPF